ncbi:hypothetical protein RBA41_28830 [Massilia sp. CCM 9210]|uniref:hypothetical protein n=1 Tax=Massilia scottii TaxID=3057166 RepID=UPI002796BD15|nr:hypothetical protein [Massilia sp. CCM 9210]MDQ1817318.1 hypothetical protein [Massilia sp. CCM 9210]
MPPVIPIAHDLVDELGQPTLYQVRNAAAPWLRAEVPEDDIEDVEFARSWALGHDGVDSIGTLQGKYQKAR